jgi:hypothetical protein
MGAILEPAQTEITKWRVQRRYSEFYRLFEQVNDMAKTVAASLDQEIPCFPPKVMLGNMRESVLVRRQAGLQRWLNALMLERSAATGDTVLSSVANQSQGRSNHIWRSATFSEAASSFAPPTSSFAPPTSSFSPPTSSFAPPISSFAPPANRWDQTPPASSLAPYSLHTPPTSSFAPYILEETCIMAVTKLVHEFLQVPPSSSSSPSGQPPQAEAPDHTQSHVHDHTQAHTRGESEGSIVGEFM